MSRRCGCIQHSERSPLGLADYSKEGSHMRRAGWSPAVIQPHPPNSEGTVCLPNTALWRWISRFWASQAVLGVKNPPASAGWARDVSLGTSLGSLGTLIPGSGRSPGGGQGNPLQYSCLGNPTDRGVWGAQYMGSYRVRHSCAHI